MICRLMTGFFDSLHERQWNPKGAPAIARLIEALDRGPHQLHLVITRANISQGVGYLAERRGRLNLAGLRTPVLFLMVMPWFTGRLSYYLREAVHAVRLLWMVWRLRPDVVYLDRSNVLVASILARLTRTPVVLRLLGVPPDLAAILEDRRLGSRLLRWAYRAPFARVICSRDGSGGAAWMARALSPDVAREVMLNGVEAPKADGAAPAALARIPAGKIVVTLLGRLEKLKASEFFVEAMLALPADRQERLHGLIVGDGYLLTELKSRVERAHAQDRITFTGALPHSQIGHALARTDIYVSVSPYCHLTNATLEAIASGVCVLLRRIAPEGQADPEFDEIVPADAVVSVPRDATAEEFALALCDLAADSVRRRAHADRLRQVAGELLWTWNRRIDHEIAELQSVADLAHA